MPELPDELRRYLEAVVEANERIVAEKRRQMDPNLREDDTPWLATENDQLGSHLKGFEDELPPGKARRLFEELVIDSTEWKTWEDVMADAEAMNKRIKKALG